MIERKALSTILELAEGYPFIALTGPRQAGKTTLSRMAFPNKPYVSLEDPDTREFAASDPRRFLAHYPDGVILDEAQRSPELFSYLQTRADMDGRMGLYILTGSQQFGLLSGITQSLAGRVGMVQLLPFSSGELIEAEMLPETIDDLLYKGSYPPLYDRKLIPANGMRATSPHIWNETSVSGCHRRSGLEINTHRDQIRRNDQRRLLLQPAEMDFMGRGRRRKSLSDLRWRRSSRQAGCGGRAMAGGEGDCRCFVNHPFFYTAKILPFAAFQLIVRSTS